MIEDSFKEYFKDLKSMAIAGTEFTPRTKLENILNEIKDDQFIKIIQEPPKEEGIDGRPDFKVEKEGLVIGYIETKRIGTNLEEIINPKDRTLRDSKQLQKYLKVIPNFILTNYTEFILFKKGEVVDRRLLFYPTDKSLDPFNIQKVNELIKSFFLVSPQVITHPKQLSNLLAERTRVFKEFLIELLENNDETNFKSRIKEGLYPVFKETLIDDLNLDEFIDAYVQTITYGLFLAELSSKKDLTGLSASDLIPESMGILRELFNTIEIKDIPDSINWIIEEIINILNHVDKEKLNNNLSFDKIYNYEDPYVYFYENFLSEYDSKKRVAKGVYYTPIPIVKFIINSIDFILHNDFQVDWFTHTNIKTLDFATGTGTFLLESFDKALSNSDPGKRQSMIKEHLLKNFYGFEYLIAPYTIAHLKLSQFLSEKGYNLNKNERLQIYLTDTLDGEQHEENPILNNLFPKISNEGSIAHKLKIKEDVLVVMGNPPYNSESKNNKKFIKELMKPYKKVNEKNKKPLNDDYIKFIRYAHWKINKKNKGIIGIISNNSFIYGPTHRTMRKEIFNTFDKIYILNLHGDMKKDKNDKNVFEIKQGVCITFLIKLPEGINQKEVYYYSTFENQLLTREGKYSLLMQNTIKDLNWQKIVPKEPFYYFTNQSNNLYDKYCNGIGLEKIFKPNKFMAGIVTGRDPLTIHYNIESLKGVIEDLIDFKTENIRKKYELSDDTRDWVLKDVKQNINEDIQNLLNKEIKSSKNLTEEDWNIIMSRRFKKVLYRPFDYRFTYYMKKSKKFLQYPRYEIMKDFIGEDKKSNIGLVFIRNFPEDKLFSHAFITDQITDKHICGGTAYVAPLNLYEKLSDEDKTNQIKFNERTKLKNPYKNRYPYPNFRDEFINFISIKYNSKPEPEEIINYIYAILYSNIYRKRYNEFLKTEYPKIYFTPDFEKFNIISKLGSELIKIHKLEKNFENSSIAKFVGDGEDIVTKIKYDSELQVLFINDCQYFENITPNIWKLEIGGYEVLKRWLNYRKGRKLSFTEITHFQNISNALNETLEIVNKIDNIILQKDINL